MAPSWGGKPPFANKCVNLLARFFTRLAMAAKKTDSFFLRIQNDHATGAGFEQVSYDLGAYVDALGKSVLRIHNVEVAYQQTAEPAKGPLANASGADMNVQYQLTTKSQTAPVLMADPSVIAMGRLFTAKDSSNQVIMIDEEANQNPSDFTNGYLVAVDEIFLGVDAPDAANAAYSVSLILECTVEKLDERAAMALALSQSS